MRTEHELAAAAQVAKFIDAAGNDVSDAHASYALTSTDQSFTSSTLRAGEGLLLEAGMLRLVDGRLIPTERLAAFVSISDRNEAAATLDRILDHQASEADRALAGAAGEEFVLAAVRDELHRLHRPMSPTDANESASSPTPSATTSTPRPLTAPCGASK